MNPEKTPDLTVQTLMALRKETDAVRVITERLKVKEMGPADHIRTKHEVKAFVETGDGILAEKLLTSAKARLAVGETLKEKLSLKQSKSHRI